MKDSSYKVEVLAPAGSYDILTAVIAAGADAVYLGGDMFGARAFAGNFCKDELIRALDYAHIRGKKIYMTVNTLLKENELNNMLVDYIAPFYEAGLDAAIVQDMGVFKTLRYNFPKLALHASTQMTVTGSYGASILEKMGATRIVTARELNFDEIRSIREQCNVEIESFVHGALCYCYSGQCLLSSMNGSRSGNRGRCAQPCRLPYDVYDRELKVNDKSSLYALSPKDMCALDILPQIIESGVNSLKIEGRMKNVTYAAGVTALYRKYTDMFLECGSDGYKVDRQDIKDLMDIYNRGEFTSGYYNHSKGREMMSVQRPNHMGTKALEVLDNVAGRVTFKVLTTVNRQDVFEIDGDNSFASGDDYAPGSKMVVNLPRKYNLQKGRILYRTRNNSITQRVIDNYVESQLRTKVNMYLYGECGMPLCLVLEAMDSTVTVYGDVVEEATKQPADPKKTAEHIGALGNTDFVADEVRVEFKGNVFIPVSRLKDLKRKGIEELTKAILGKSRREAPETAKPQETLEVSETPEVSEKQEKTEKSVLVTDMKQLEMAVKSLQYSDMYVDFTVVDNVTFEDIQGYIRKYDMKRPTGQGECTGEHRNQRIILALPHILRGKNSDRCRKLIERSADYGFDGFLVRNLEEFGLIAKLAAEPEYKGSRNIVLDSGLYCWNTSALDEYKNVSENAGLKLEKITFSYELKSEELIPVAEKASNMGIKTELVVSSRIPLMVSEQCVRKTYGLCDKSNGVIRLANMKNGDYVVKSVCGYCYSIMYSGKYDITDMKPQIEVLKPDFIRYEYAYDDLTPQCVSTFAGHFEIGVD